MYDIITAEPEDDVVQEVIKSIIASDKDLINPNHNYVLHYLNATTQKGDGGDSDTLVVVGHGNPTTLSGCKTWDAYQEKFDDSEIAWHRKKMVILVACSTAKESEEVFAYGNFARSVKAKFGSGVSVWAASSVVGKSLLADWHKVE